MPKDKKVFECYSCGYETAKWSGQCPSCGEWNTLQEKEQSEIKITYDKKKTFESVLSIDSIKPGSEIRYKTGISELDRVLGGGIVKGSVMLVSGDPGIGKSTIMLQICDKLPDLKVLYVSGEESQGQLKLRANRLNIKGNNVSVMCDTDVETVIAYIEKNHPDIVIIDSIQTMNLESISSSPGSVTQIRECSNAFLHCAKRLEIPVFIVGHVNKDGAIAGPKVLEHIVDAVLYIEGERNMSYRIFRAVKNRFGSTNEIGVFEMSEKGLVEVTNPSLMLLSGRPLNVSGNCVACAMEGSRPIMAEVQGLITATSFGNPRRMATGFDLNRLNMLLAVLEKRAGYYFSNIDAYINVVGGLKLDEPSADLTVALALVSGLKDIPVPEDVIAFGEVGLAGEVRTVGHAAARVSEAIRLGFKCCVIPKGNLAEVEHLKDKIRIVGAEYVREAFECIGG